MKTKIEQLTPEQIAKIPIYAEKWKSKLNDLPIYSKEEIIEANQKLYEFCGLKQPEVIVVGSPIGCQLAANLSNVRANVLNNVVDNVLNNVRNNVSNNVWANVRDNVRDNVGDNVRENVRENNLKFYDFCQYGDISDFGWLSFYDFFLNECGLISDFREKLELISNASTCSFMSIQLDGLCIVSKFPTKIKRNNAGQLHSLDESAISFVDSYEQHYFNGIYIKPELFSKLINKEYLFEDFTKEENEETKSLILAFYEEKFGGEFVYRFISEHLKEIDTYTNKKEAKYLENTTGMNIGVYTLFKGEIGSINIAYVRCYCPSTDRMFFLGVHDEISNAKDAIASLCQVPTKLKKHLTSINRQGEIFSFNFDKKGTEILKSKKLTKNDFQEVESLSGDEYFNKLKFEY